MQVHFEIGIIENGDGVVIAVRTSVEQRSNPCYKFAHFKGFDQIIISTSIKTIHFIIGGAQAVKNNNGNISFGLFNEFPQINPIIFWQNDIGDDEVEIVL